MAFGCKKVAIFLGLSVNPSVPGKRILVLNGGYRGNVGTLESINEKTFSATVVIETVSILLKGRNLKMLLKCAMVPPPIGWVVCFISFNFMSVMYYSNIVDLQCCVHF